MKNERTYQVIIGVLVLIIVLGGWYFVARKGTTTSEDGADSTSSTVTVDQGGASAATDQNPTPDTSMGSTGSSVIVNTAVSSGDVVSVSDQSAGSSVVVKSVSLSQSGWVAIRDSGGRILGAAWFPAGSQSDVPVPLLRATSAGEHYQVLLYADDGDKVFDFHKETLITNSDGSVAGTNFTAN